jgi:superfamily II DNA or RNA helicase
MLKLVIDNVNTRVVGAYDPNPVKAHEIHEALREELSYVVPNAEWSPSFKEGKWDGKISLYYRRNQSFPAGLTSRVSRLLREREIDFAFSDQREKPAADYPITCDFGNKELRFYQTAAGDVAAKYQRGVIAAATGAGKTMLSCYLLSKISVKPVVFIVPAIELLRQTQREFEKYLRLDGKPIKVGMAGGGTCDLNPEGINIITYQTALAAFDEKYQEKGNKIVAADNLGDKNRKTTKELEQELEVAEKALARAKSASERELAAKQQGVDRLHNAVVALEASEPPRSDKIAYREWKKELTESTKALRAEEREYARAVKALIQGPQETYNKALAAVQNRYRILEDKASIRSLIENCRAMIVDEAHVAAVVIECLGGHAAKAYYRIGLSATPWREDNQEIRIEGTLGKKLFEITASDLIELGFLVPPTIFMIRINHLEHADDYADAYNKHVTRCWERNWRIKQCAESFKDAGRPVLILVERREHGEILESMIKDAVFVPGGDKGEDDPTDEERNYRRRMLNRVEANEIILIATQWANVGVDAPAISTLILAGSSQSSVTTYQQVGRVLRCLGKDAQESAENGKPDAIVIDFMDEHKALRKHSMKRKKVYQRERAFKYKPIT